MALLGISLIVASVVFVIIRPPTWLPPQLLPWTWFRAIEAPPTTSKQELDANKTRKSTTNGSSTKQIDEKPQSTTTGIDAQSTMPPPPLPSTIVTSPPSPPSIDEPDSPTTPKAGSPPTFSITADEPAAAPPSTSASASALMPPPPLPAKSRTRPPTLNQFPAANSAQRARAPIPNRGAGGGLAPPPTHSSAPAKPSRKVTLEPGHSPLDWARISGPNADLRGLEASSPYLRVTPSMLKKQTGRKGKDAWMAINGKVYNITPYAAFHPGGVPELMRGAARDGTRLFGEIHPWVNYETMLTACLVGLLVDEPEAQAESEMDKMD